MTDGQKMAIVAALAIGCVSAYGIYQYKIGFGGNIIEYPERMLLIIDKNKYLMYSQICNLKRKSITM